MARDPIRSQKKYGDRTPGPDRAAAEKPAAPEENRTVDNTSAATRSVSTNDPAVRSEADRVRNPTASYSLETNQANAGETIASPPGSAAESKDVVERSSPASREDRTEGARSDAALRQQHPAASDDRRSEQRRPEDASSTSGVESREHESRRQEIPYREGWSWKSLALTAVVALICGAAGAWAYAKFLGPSKEDEKQNSQQAHGGKSGGSQSSKKSSSKKRSGSGESSNETGSDDSASEIPGFTSADDAETLKKQIKHLAHRLDSLSQRIDNTQAPANETPPALHTLQTQVGELAKSIDETAKLPAQVRHLDHRLSSLVEEFKTLRDEIAPQETSAESNPSKTQAADLSSDKSADSPATSQDEAPATPSDEDEADVNDDDATFDLAVGLFKAGRYAQSRDVFRRLQQARPHDARVWYYSALANGLVTHAWDGETKRLFERGAARERAGTPEKAQIDETMAAKMPEEARRELDKYRRQAVTDNADQTKAHGKQQYQLNNDSLKVP